MHRWNWLRRFLPGFVLWLCLAKLPGTAQRDSIPQSWEAVLSFAAAHHLQWGRDIVFSFGPLGFLTSDYYWGNFFLLILLWAFGFSLLLTNVILRFSQGGNPLLRAALCAGLIFLTVPACSDLGFDPIYLLSISAISIACLPEERPGVVRLIVSGAVLGVISLIKFTFAMYCLFALCVLALGYAAIRRPRPLMMVLGSAAASFLGAWLLLGQDLGNIPLYFRRNLQVASGYSSAMGLAAGYADLVFAAVIWMFLAGLVLLLWLGSKDWRQRTTRAGIVGAGIFLAWKEAFVRADAHVTVFPVYAFILAALLPALLSGATEARQKAIPLVAATIMVCSGWLFLEHTAFIGAIRTGFFPRLSDTVTALFAPPAFKHSLEGYLESMRERAALPKIRAEVGAASVGVLSFQQDLAILNDLNFKPHPVFQSYSAFSPELQRVNSDFFNSDQAPQYVLWRFGTVDWRFPSLDDGEVMLRMLSSYSPIIEEKNCTLWKRHALREGDYSLLDQKKDTGSLDEWIAIPAGATWLRVQFHKTRLGSVQDFLWRTSIIWLEVKLESGRTSRYRLLAGNASSGFLINPLFHSDADLIGLSAPDHHRPARVVAARVSAESRFAYDQTYGYALSAVQGIQKLDSEPPAGSETASNPGTAMKLDK